MFYYLSLGLSLQGSLRWEGGLKEATLLRDHPMNVTRRGERHSAAGSSPAQAPAPPLQSQQRSLGLWAAPGMGQRSGAPSSTAAASPTGPVELTGVSARTACRRAMMRHCHVTAEPEAGTVGQGNEQKINSRHSRVHNQIYLRPYERPLQRFPEILVSGWGQEGIKFQLTMPPTPTPQPIWSGKA